MTISDGPIAREDSYTGYLRRKYQGGQGSQGCRVEGTGNGGVTNKDLGAVIFVLERRQKTAAFDDNGSLRRTGEDRGATESGNG